MFLLLTIRERERANEETHIITKEEQRKEEKWHEINVDIHAKPKSLRSLIMRLNKRKTDRNTENTQERAPMHTNPSPRAKPQPTTFLPPAAAGGVGVPAVVFVVVFVLPDGVFAGGGAEAGGLAPNNSSGNSTLSTW